MRNIFKAFIVLSSTALLSACTTKADAESISVVTDPVSYVNTLVGSQSDSALSTGNTYPAIAMPWGMNFWTPQTGKNGDGWAYTYTAKTIRGFKQTHQPSPWINDYGQFSLMPVTNFTTVDEDARASHFSHQAEEAHPYYYSVYLADHDVLAEITPTERAAMMRFTFPESNSSAIIIDAFDKGSEIKLLGDNQTVIGYTTRNSGGVPANFKNYFVIKFDHKVEKAELYNDTDLTRKKKLTADHVQAAIHFNTNKGEQIMAQVASSFVSPEQALINLRELEGHRFDELVTMGQNRWDRVLGRIQVGGGTLDQYRTFYSCLYRSTLFPRKLWEVDAEGNIIHYSPYNGEVRPGYMYTDTGFWDTFRALFPLLNLVYPDENQKIQEGLANAAEESGFLPEWASPGHRNCMVGNNSASVVADAILKDVNTKDMTELYNVLQHDANNVHPNIKSSGRLGHEYYNKLGYVPYNVGINENVARTLEYAYDDWCILQVAKKLNRPQEEIDELTKRAQNYRNVFDPAVGLMRGKNEDGSFQKPFSPFKWGDAFTEGNSWHYTWSVFHDINGLIDLMGGKKEFIKQLDYLFVAPPIYDDSYYGSRIHEILEMQIANMGNYAHGNQPAQHITYLYDYVGQPWKTQYWVREVMNRLYQATPNGYCGDEDNGQTSAWYIFSALGFYPVCPGSPQYALGAPLFKKTIIHLENGETINIDAPANSADNRYVDNIDINGENYSKNYLSYPELIKGMTIQFKMQSKANKQRGTGEEDAPYSMSTAK